MIDETNKELCFAYIDDKTCGALEKKRLFVMSVL